MSVCVCICSRDSLCHFVFDHFSFYSSQITWHHFHVHKLLALITIKHTIHRLCVILLLFRWEYFPSAQSVCVFLFLSFSVFFSLSSSTIVVLISRLDFFSPCVRVVFIKTTNSTIIKIIYFVQEFCAQCKFFKRLFNAQSNSYFFFSRLFHFSQSILFFYLVSKMHKFV